MTRKALRDNRLSLRNMMTKLMRMRKWKIVKNISVKHQPSPLKFVQVNLWVAGVRNGVLPGQQLAEVL